MIAVPDYFSPQRMFQPAFLPAELVAVGVCLMSSVQAHLPTAGCNLPQVVFQSLVDFANNQTALVDTVSALSIRGIAVVVPMDDQVKEFQRRLLQP